MSALHPEPPDRRGEPETHLPLAVLQGPAESGAQVVMLAAQTVQPGDVPLLEGSRGGLGKAREPGEVGVTDQRRFIGLCEAFSCVLANQLEHLEAWLVAAVCGGSDEALVDQCGEAV